MTPSRPRLLTIAGPTATGKSALAAELALEFGGEVINADSRLFYRGFDIGTAKPDASERRGVPHHLIDCLGPGEAFSLWSFLDAARLLIDEITQRGRLPVLAGGTGQYVWGLLEGWDVPRTAPDPELRRTLEGELAERGVAALFERLQEADPEGAVAVDRRNPRRVIRALERASAGHGGGTPGRSAEPPYDALVIGLTLPRPELYRRVDERIEAMAAAGWADEVRRLLSQGVTADSPAMSSIGYREMAAHVGGELSLAEALAGAKRSTRRLVRHQYNWFKLSDGRVKWLSAGPGAAAEAKALVRDWLLTG